MNRRFTFLWALVLILALFAVSGAGYYAQASYLAYLERGEYIGSVDDETGNPLAFVGTVASVLLVPVALFALSRRISPFIVAFLLFPAWVGVTAAWSDVIAPTMTIVVKTIVYALGIGTAVRYLNHRQVLQCVAIVALGICGVSLYLCFSDPIFRISIGAEGWRGLFMQKNRFAMFALFSIFLLFPAVFARNTRAMAVVALPVLIACLILSQGKAALAIALVYMAVTGSFVMLSGKREASKRSLLGISLTLVALLIAAAVVIGVLITLGGVTFTGRVDLWRWFLDDLGNHWLFGAGGLTAPSDPAFVERAQRAGKIPSPDSSYVMMIYNQGVIGVMLYVAVITAMWTRVIKIGGSNAIFSIMTLACYLTFAFFESDARLSLAYPGAALVLQLLLLEKSAKQGRSAVAARASRSAALRTDPITT